jgi:hypothetical protein
MRTSVLPVLRPQLFEVVNPAATDPVGKRAPQHRAALGQQVDGFLDEIRAHRILLCQFEQPQLHRRMEIDLPAHGPHPSVRREASEGNPYTFSSNG